MIKKKEKCIKPGKTTHAVKSRIIVQRKHKGASLVLALFCFLMNVLLL